MIQIDQRRLPCPPTKLPPVTRHDPFGRGTPKPPRPSPAPEPSPFAAPRGMASQLGLPAPVINWPVAED